MSLSNEEIFIELEKYRFKNKADGWTVKVETGTFHLQVNNIAGNEEIEHIKDCKEVQIQIFDQETMPPAEELTIPDLTVGDFTIKFDVTCFPHKDINPQNDTRFKDQPWASKINHIFGLGTQGTVTISELCDIIRYCIKLPKLKAFL